MTGGFGGGAEVLVGVLGSYQQEAAQREAAVRRGGAAAQLALEWGELIGACGDELIDQLGVGQYAQSVPVKSLKESGRKALSFSTDSIQERMSASCSPSQLR